MKTRTEKLSRGMHAVYAEGPEAILLGLVKRVGFNNYKIETGAGNGGQFRTLSLAADAVARVDELTTKVLPSLVAKRVPGSAKVPYIEYNRAPRGFVQ